MQSESDLVRLEAQHEPAPNFMDQQSEEMSAAKERYLYFTRPEPRENMSDIYEEEDPYLGRTKCRDLRIGMLRNAAEENKQVVKAYLEPFPHLRITDAKQLQGWYKPKFEEPGRRPRPCFTEALLTEPYGGYCAVGCAFCFPAGELVDTFEGPIPIEELQAGDLVWGRDVSGPVLTKVLASLNRSVRQLVVIELHDGRQLTCTPNHPIWSQTKMEWVNAENLQPGEALQDLRETFTRRQDVLQSNVLGCSQPPAKKTSQAMLLWRRDQEVSSGMRQVQLDDSFCQWQVKQGTVAAKFAEAQIRNNQTAYEGVCIGPSGGDEPTGKWPQVSCVETTGCRTGKGGNSWLPFVQEKNLRLSKGTQNLDAVRMGAVDSPVFRPTGMGLGVRAVDNFSPERRQLPPRFSSSRSNISRSQGLLEYKRQSQGRRGEGTGAQSFTIRPERAGTSVNSTIKKISRVQGTFQVYDIQTSAENFYVRGVLVHNCYINSGMRGYRGSGLISVPMNYGAQIEKQLTKLRRGAAVYFSSFTDPFTPLEDYYHNTETAARACVAVGLPVFFLSRLKYPDWAIEILQQNKHSYAQKSINTSDPDDWRKLSPGALGLQEHLEDIAKIKAAGIYVSIQVNPIVPGITSNEQIVRLFKLLKEAGADHVIVKFVEAAYSWAPAMVERMKKNFGAERGAEFEKLFTQNIGSERTVEESYRLSSHKLFSSYARRYGLTYATCYEYRYERDASGKVLNKTGVSIGREFTTAAQCHGPAVPMYTRMSAEEKFVPVEACPPSGCLYCADENDGQPRCGDAVAGQAKALKMVDLKLPIIQ